MVLQRNRRIHSGSGFFGSFDAPWSERSWIDLFSKETQNLFSDSFRFKNKILDFLKETHPKTPMLVWRDVPKSDLVRLMEKRLPSFKGGINLIKHKRGWRSRSRHFQFCDVFRFEDEWHHDTKLICRKDCLSPWISGPPLFLLSLYSLLGCTLC